MRDKDKLNKNQSAIILRARTDDWTLNSLIELEQQQQLDLTNITTNITELTVVTVEEKSKNDHLHHHQTKIQINSKFKLFLLGSKVQCSPLSNFCLLDQFVFNY